MITNLRRFSIVLQLIGAVLIAINIVSPAIGFGVFIISQLIFVPICIHKRDWALACLFFGFMLIDIFGLIRWL